MMGRTHALAGVASLWMLRTVPSALTSDNTLPLLVLSVFGALVPDLDAADSLLHRTSLLGITPLVPLSSLLHANFGHRGATHSLIGFGTAVMLSLPIAFAWGSAPVAFALGYGSHLLCDAATKSGIPMFYPKRQRWHLLPRPLLLTTGSDTEGVLFALFAVLALGLLLSVLSLSFSF